MSAQKTALVTGGNRGIGLEICRQLVQQGFRVFLAGRDESGIRAAAEGVGAEPLLLDVSDEASIAHAAQALSASIVQLDVLVNNAGILPDRGREGLDFTRAGLLAGMETNAWGPLFLSRALLPLLSRSGGAQVINVSSGMGQLTGMRDGDTAYRISKAALNAVTLILSSEFSDRDIAVNSVSPGWVKTDMGGANAPDTPAQGADTVIWLATGGASGASGGFYQNRKLISW